MHYNIILNIANYALILYATKTKTKNAQKIKIRNLLIPNKSLKLEPNNMKNSMKFKTISKSENISKGKNS